MRAIPLLLAHSSVELIVVGVFLLALFIRWLFLHFRRSWIGFWAGLACIAAAEAIVQVIITPPPGACGSSGVNCEWLGIGRLFLLLLGIGLAAGYLILGRIVSRAYRRLVPPGDSTRQVKAGTLWLLSAGLLLGALVGLALGIVVTNVAESGLGIPWQAMPNIPLASGEKISRLAAAGTYFVILETDPPRLLRGRFDPSSPDLLPTWDILPAGSVGSGKPLADFQPCSIDFWVPAPPRAALAYASARVCGDAPAQADFALADGATLFVWHRQVTLASFPDYNLAALAGPALGFALALVAALLVERKRAGAT